MTLETRLSALITAVGADIKAIKTGMSGSVKAAVSTANQTIAGATDTYIAGSGITVPDGTLQVGTIYKLKFNAVKTAAGVATPIINVRIGTAGTTADTSQGVLTLAAQTAVIDEGYIEVIGVFRVAGASAVLQTLANLSHRLAATGLSTSGSATAIATSGTFNSAATNLKIGCSLNVGTSGSWVISLVSAELVNTATPGGYVGPKITVAGTAPTSPAVGDVWIDTSA